MATAKSVSRTLPGKRAAAVAVTDTAKAKPAARAKPPAKPKPVVETRALPKSGAKPAAKSGAKPAPKPAPKPATAKTVRSRAKKPAGVPLEQRRNYIEVAAYYIAERRGFAPGNPLEDWVQAEAEIDRLIAEGRLGG